jgi:prophage regulatory protein
MTASRPHPRSPCRTLFAQADRQPFRATEWRAPVEAATPQELRRNLARGGTTACWIIGQDEEESIMAGADPRGARRPVDSTEACALLRLPKVLQLTGLKKTTLYGLMRRNGFPRPVQLTDRLVAWRSTDVAGWAQGRETK